jgi:hypothetical protein
MRGIKTSLSYDVGGWQRHLLLLCPGIPSALPARVRGSPTRSLRHHDPRAASRDPSNPIAGKWIADNGDYDNGDYDNMQNGDYDNGDYDNGANGLADSVS